MSAQMPQSNQDTALVVRKSADLQEITARPITFEPLNPMDEARAREEAKTLIPADSRFTRVVAIGAKERRGLSTVIDSLNNEITVGDLEKASGLSTQVLGYIDTLNIDDLSPEARNKFLMIKETLEDIANRVKAFFERYQTLKQKLDRIQSEIEGMQAERVNYSNRLDALYIENRRLMLELRVAIAAGKYYLRDYGYPQQKELQAKVEAETAAAKAEGRMIDRDLVQQLQDINGYLQRVETTINNMQGAITSAYQTGEAIRMMQGNELFIAQKLSDVVETVLPEWKKLLFLAYEAYRAHGAAAFAEQVDAKSAALRRATADKLGEVADETAALMRTQSFDPDSLKYFNDKLVEALKVIQEASVEQRKIHAAAEESGQRLMVELADAVAETSKR